MWRAQDLPSCMVDDFLVRAQQQEVFHPNMVSMRAQAQCCCWSLAECLTHMAVRRTCMLVALHAQCLTHMAVRRTCTQVVAFRHGTSEGWGRIIRAANGIVDVDVWPGTGNRQLQLPTRCVMGHFTADLALKELRKCDNQVEHALRQLSLPEFRYQPHMCCSANGMRACLKLQRHALSGDDGDVELDGAYLMR